MDKRLKKPYKVHTKPNGLNINNALASYHRTTVDWAVSNRMLGVRIEHRNGDFLILELFFFLVGLWCFFDGKFGAIQSNGPIQWLIVVNCFGFLLFFFCGFVLWHRVWAERGVEKHIVLDAISIFVGVVLLLCGCCCIVDTWEI